MSEPPAPRDPGSEAPVPGASAGEPARRVVLTVGEAAVGRIAAAVAREVPGVSALRPDLGRALLGLAGSLLGEPAEGLPAAAAVVGEGRAEITLALTTSLGHNARDLAVAVQRAVAARVEADTGLATVVTVTIADITV